MLDSHAVNKLLKPLEDEIKDAGAKNHLLPYPTLQPNERRCNEFGWAEVVEAAARIDDQ